MCSVEDDPSQHNICLHDGITDNSDCEKALPTKECGHPEGVWCACVKHADIAPDLKECFVCGEFHGTREAGTECGDWGNS